MKIWTQRRQLWIDRMLVKSDADFAFLCTFVDSDNTPRLFPRLDDQEPALFSYWSQEISPFARFLVTKRSVSSMLLHSLNPNHNR